MEFLANNVIESERSMITRCTNVVAVAVVVVDPGRTRSFALSGCGGRAVTRVVAARETKTIQSKAERIRFIRFGRSRGKSFRTECRFSI